MSKRTPDADAKTRITISLPEALVKDAKHYAVDQDVDLQDVVADALRAYLTKKGGR